MDTRHLTQSEREYLLKLSGEVGLSEILRCLGQVAANSIEDMGVADSVRRDINRVALFLDPTRK